MSTLWQDIRYAARLMRKNLGFSAIAILTLALGIGANSAIFSLVYGVLLRPLPYPQAGRIVYLKPTYRSGARNDATTGPKYLFWSEHQHSFKAMATYRGGGGVNLQTTDQPERVLTNAVTAQFFHVLGLNPIIGRDYATGEDQPGSNGGAILSEGFWRRRFAADPGVLGKPIILGNNTYEIIGVAPSGIDTQLAADVFVPLIVKGNALANGMNFPVVARLQDNVSMSQAAAEMRVIAEQFRSAHPKAMEKSETIGLFEYQRESVRDVRPSLLILLCSVGLVLLIGCANVANLLLARVATRHREIAVRLAIGASRWRVRRQLLTESLVLAFTGSLLGLLIAKATIASIVQFHPVQLPRLDNIALDWPVIAFTIVVGLIVGSLCGTILPSVSLQENRSTSRKAGQLRGILVSAEFALSMILLVGATLLIQSFIKLRMVDPGFDPSHVLTMRMTLNAQRYRAAAQVASFANQVASRVKQVPGVETVTMTNYLPLSAGMNIPLASVVGQPNAGNQFLGNLEWFGVSPGFFDVMRMHIRQGRAIDDRDTAASPPVVIVNEAFVKKYLPNENATGQQIVIAWDLLGPKAADPVRQIAGVVSDIHEGSLKTAPSPTVFVPLTQVNDAIAATVNQIMPTTLMARSTGDPLSISRQIAAEVHAQDPMLPVFQIRTMEQVVGESIREQRFMMTILGTFAALALILAAIGIYGVMSYAVAQKTRELGIRAALGATPQSLMRMIVKQGLILAAIGIVVGIAGAASLTSVLKSYLYGVASRDTLTFVLAPFLLTAIGMFACYIPARRALRIDPVTALRQD